MFRRRVQPNLSVFKVTGLESARASHASLRRMSRDNQHVLPTSEQHVDGRCLPSRSPACWRSHWRTLIPSLQGAFQSGLAVLCVACGSASAPAAHAPPPTRTAVQDEGVRRLLLDTATGQVCPRTKNRFLGVPSAAEHPLCGTASQWPCVAGRWLVQTCNPKGDGQALNLQVYGVGWTWVDQRREKYFADFTVRQHVYFTATASVQGALDVAYDDQRRIASVWLTPTAAPQADFHPITTINAQPDGVLARFYDTVARGKVQKGAQDAAEQTGREKFLQALSRGATITYNTSTLQLDLQLGYLANGAVPQRPFPSPRWLVNERQELHPGGVQIAGPFPFMRAASLDVVVEQGVDVQFTTACADAAQALVGQLASGQPQVAGLLSGPIGRILVGQRGPIWVTPPPCDWVLITTSQSDTIAGIHLVPPI